MKYAITLPANPIEAHGTQHPDENVMWNVATITRLHQDANTKHQNRDDKQSMSSKLQRNFAFAEQRRSV